MDNLIVRGMYIPNRCCLCMADGESSGHLFIHCPWVGPLWCYFLSRFGVVWVHPNSIRSLLQYWEFQKCGSSKGIGRFTWKVVPATLCWAVWEERNMRMFEDSSKSQQMIIDATFSKLYDWVFVGQNWELHPFCSWIFYWDSCIM